MISGKHEKIAAARKIFGSYSRMKLEIDTLSKSIEFYSAHKDEEISVDIYNKSVSHCAEGSCGANPNTSADKLPHIAESIESMYRDYDSCLSFLKFRQNVLAHAVDCADTFISHQSEEKALILRRLYTDRTRKTFGEISSEINLSERRIKQIVNGMLLEFAETANYDLELIISLPPNK